MKIRRCFAVLVVLLSMSTNIIAAEQEISPEKRAAIEKLLEVTGAVERGKLLSSVMVAQMTEILRATHAIIHRKLWMFFPK
jgi:hypothetical protein